MKKAVVRKFLLNASAALSTAGAAFVYTVWVDIDAFGTDVSRRGASVWITGWTEKTICLALGISILSGMLAFLLVRKRGVIPALPLQAGWLPILSLNGYWEPVFRFPLFLLRWFPLILPVVAILFMCIAISDSWKLNLPQLTPNRKLLLLGLLVFSVSILSAGTVFEHLGLVGDEPHYLKIAQSIFDDFDLDIRNQEPGYSRYWPGDWCRLHHLNRVPDERLISIHSPGLPLLIALPFGAGGRLGVAVFLSVILAITAMGTFKLTQMISENHFVWWIMICIFCGSPLLLFGFQIYPELLAAASIVIILLEINGPRQWWAGQMIAGVCLALLPWLHSKYALIAFASAILCGVTYRHSKRALIRIFVIPFLSCLLYFSYNTSQFGSIMPFRAYSEFAQDTAVIETNPLYGLAYYLLDGRQSFLLYGPLFILSVLGVRELFKHNRKLAVHTSILILIHLPVVLGHVTDRWLGWSPPHRFIVPLLPLLALFIAAAVSRFNHRFPFLVYCGLLGGYHQYIAWKFVQNPAFIHQRGRLFNAWEGGAIQPSNIFPLIPDHAEILSLLALMCFALFMFFIAPFILLISNRISNGSAAMSLKIVLALCGCVFVSLGVMHSFPGTAEMTTTEISADLDSHRIEFLTQMTRNSSQDGIVVSWIRQPTALRKQFRVTSAHNNNRTILFPPGSSLADLHEKIGPFTQNRVLMKPIIWSELASVASPHDPGIADTLLDLYRARRAWEQVISTVEHLRKIQGSLYSQEELATIQWGAKKCLALAYLSLSKIENLTEARQSQFLSKYYKWNSELDLHLTQPIAFKMLPELESLGVWPV